MKKALFAALLLIVLFAPVVTIAAGLEGPLVPSPQSAGKNTGGAAYTFCDLRTLANNLITFGVALSVFVATLMFAYGGVLYVTGASGGQAQIKKAHTVLLNALVGILIVLLAWLIINIVLSVLSGRSITDWTSWFGGSGCAPNPIASGFSSSNSVAPNPGPEKGAGSPGTLRSGTLSNDDALKQLHDAGVCGTADQCLKAGASLQGIQQSTVDGMIQLHKACGCEFTITSGTDGSHAGGDYSHSSGYKVDLRTSDNNSLNSYIDHNFSGPVSVIWGGVPSQQYKDGCGNLYTNEGDHWDIGYLHGCNYSGG